MANASDENVSTSTTTASVQEKKMSAPTSKNPFVLMTSNPTAGVALMAGLPVLTLMLSYFLFKSSPAEKKDDKKEDKTVAAQVAPAPQLQLQSQPQLAYYQPPQYAVQPQPQISGLLPMAAAPQPSQQGTASFVVASAGKNSRGWVFLNDTPDYKMATRTIVVKNPAILGQWAAEPKMIQGRVVTATGIQTSYNGKPQIDAAQVNIQ